MSATSRALRAVIAVAALAAFLPSTAGAAGVRVDGTTVIYDAALGEQNSVNISEVGGKLRFSDVVDITAGAGCAEVNNNPQLIDCNLGAATVNLNDLGDLLDVSGALTNGLLVNGGDGDDGIGGSNLADQINGGNGNDSLVGGAGDDKLRGGADDDEAFGNLGADELVGESGNDGPLVGGDDNDTIDGGPGRDFTLNGSFGDDRVSGGDDADDELRGGPGNDTIDAGNGDDFDANGGDGNDTVLLGAGNDSPQGFGGGGFDDGIDNYQGGPGDDFFAPVPGGTGADIYDGNEGLDSIVMNSYAVDVTIIIDGAANDGSAGEGDNILGFEDLAGGPGNDLLVGGAASRTISGNAGNDTLGGSAASEQLFGASGDDSISGNGGNDQLFGNDGNDGMAGGDGNDRLDGGFGADSLSGGPGADTGDWSGRELPVTLTPNNVADDGEINEGDSLAADVENLFTGSANDVVVGPPGPSLIDTGDGDDQINGRDNAADVIICGHGVDAAVVDAIDSPDTQGFERCETVDRPAAAALAPGLSVTRKTSRAGTLTLRITCPLLASVGCQGTASLAGNRGKGSFTTPAATTTTLKIKLSSAARRSLRRRGRLRVAITVKVTDAAGRTGTVTRTVTLRR